MYHLRPVMPRAQLRISACIGDGVYGRDSYPTPLTFLKELLFFILRREGRNPVVDERPDINPNEPILEYRISYLIYPGRIFDPGCQVRPVVGRIEEDRDVPVLARIRPRRHVRRT